MATIHVSLAGSDANNGSSLEFAKRTIAAGVTAAATGDTVLVYGDAVGAGIYNESVVPKSGVTIDSEPTLPRPIMDSNYTLQGAISSGAGVSGFHVKNLEIRRYLRYGVRAVGPGTLVDGHPNPGGAQHNNTVQGCHIHHIEGRRTTANEHSYGCNLTYGNWKVLDCEIHHIHGWNESTGIWFGYCKNHVAALNTIYSIRKEGIRSYMGYGSYVHSNILYLCWYALCANEDAGGVWANNWGAHCTGGMNPKHTNDPLRVLPYWGLPEGSIAFSRFWHNTFHRCSWAQNVVAINDNGDGTGDTWDLDQRNNIYSGKSPCAVWDSPSFRSGTWIHDYNLYSTHPSPPTGTFSAIGNGLPSFAYKTGFSNGVNVKTLAQVRTDLGLDLNSVELDPQFNDPETCDFDYPDSSPAHNAGQDLTAQGSSLGAQMGGRGLTPHRNVTYTPFTLTAIASRSGLHSATRDENIFTNYSDSLTTGPMWFSYDLGSEKTFNHVFGDNLSHNGVQNARRITLASGPTTTGPWTVFLDYTIHDAGGSSWKAELLSPITARYLRWELLTAAGSTSVAANDLRIGFLTNQSAGGDPDPGDTTAPTVTLTAPTAGEVLEGEIVLNAVASDNIGVDRVEFYANDTLLIATDATDPYAAIWPTTPQDAGQHSLTARAYDAAGNMTVSSPVIITVATPALPPDAVGTGDYYGVLG
jgi:hypothetical protein